MVDEDKPAHTAGKVGEARLVRNPTTPDQRDPAAVGHGDRARRRPYLSKEYALLAYVIVVIAALIVLRAVVDALDFLGVGWIIVLAFVPLLPWLLPRFGEFLRAISPYVQSLKLGVVQLELRAVRSEPVSVPTSGGILASVPNDLAALSSGTTISLIISSLRERRLQGGSPAGVIDLQDGRKWRLPNLYFLARLLEMDPVVDELVFTDVRGGTDGYLVGTCRPDEFRRQVEQALPNYTSAVANLHLPFKADLGDPAQAQQLGDKFAEFLSALGQWTGSDDDPSFGFVGTRRMSELANILSGAAIEAPDATLTERSLHTVIDAPHRFVPITAGGRLTGLIDRDAVALAVARVVFTRS